MDPHRFGSPGSGSASNGIFENEINKPGPQPFKMPMYRYPDPLCGIMMEPDPYALDRGSGFARIRILLGSWIVIHIKFKIQELYRFKIEPWKAVYAHNWGVEAQKWGRGGVWRLVVAYSHLFDGDPDPVRFEGKSSIRLCLYVLKPVPMETSHWFEVNKNFILALLLCRGISHALWTNFRPMPDQRKTTWVCHAFFKHSSHFSSFLSNLLLSTSVCLYWL